MKNYFKLIAFQFLSACISGLLISKMSLVGKLGITLFYKEYSIFKSFWQTALLLFVIQLVFILCVYLATLILKNKSILGVVLAMLVLLGLGATVYDFQTEISHRMLKGYFHAGFYLFWLSMMVSIFYILLLQKPPAVIPISAD